MMNKGYKLKHKLYLSTLTLFTLFLLLFAIIIIPNLNKRILDERKLKLKAVVDLVFSLIVDYEETYRNNPELDLDKLQEEFLNVAKKLRYEKNEYFFILNGDGRMIMNPLQPEILFWNMNYETDHNGRRVFRDVILGAMKDDEIFVDTHWQSKYNDQIFEDQILYGKYFWSWDWIICSTLFTQDLKDANLRFIIYILVYLVITSLFVFFLLFLFIKIQVTKPLDALLEGIYNIQKNDLTHSVEAIREDEIGYIARQFNTMIKNRKRYEDQLIHSQKKEIVATLASGVAHDFNNVISSISLAAGLLNESLYKDSEEINRDYINTIKICCDRASSIVNQLVTFSGNKSMKMCDIDINDIFYHIEALCKITIDKSIQLTIEKSDEKQMVTADQVQIEQTILNLCINASHAMTFMRPSGDLWGGRLIVKNERTTKVESPHINYWKIHIIDQGIGMDQVTQERIFDPFFSTKAKNQGSGLGLAMTKKIITDHEGMIEVVSKPGEGTTFLLYLPIKE